MARIHRGTALSQIHRLFDEGTLAGLPDGRLLERYVVERDELAFETLVKRHGRMVTAVCQGVVEDPHDAEDAFQAAFLLLARKARTLWVDDSLGGWLHRVACRIALQVRYDAARRREHERRAAERLPAALVHPWTGMTYRRSSTRRLTVCPSDTASRSCSATSKR